MTINRDQTYLAGLVEELRKQPNETEWLEFKQNNEKPDSIGEYISALANSAAYHGKVSAYMIWGIADSSHEVVGTSFSPNETKIGNEELENWLLSLLTPKLNFDFHSLEHESKSVVILEIHAASRQPVSFQGQEFIRVGSYKKKLKAHPEKERALWRIFDAIPFENEIALSHLEEGEVLELLDFESYFSLLQIPIPQNNATILEALEAEALVKVDQTSLWNITNLGAALFANKLNRFPKLKRKAIRVILYKGNNRVETVKERSGEKGYAAGFVGLLKFINGLFPTNEVIGQSLRKELPMFPVLAVRELVANALIHQDFNQSGNGPMVEVFDNRIEVTNPGQPLISPERFLDSPPKSRNEALASLLRRIGICEERGSGIDKVVFQTEFYQLPAPIFESIEDYTRCVLFAHKELKKMDKEERIRACYLHACLTHVQRDPMTNNSLRKRFAMEAKNSAMASRIIKDTMSAGLIHLQDSTVGSKARKYLPWWA